MAPLSEGRRRGVSASLTRLSAAYAELDDMKNWRFGTTVLYGTILALVIGVVLYGILASPRVPSERGEWTTAVVGIAVLFWLAYVYLIRSGVKAVAEDLQKRAEALVEEIATDFREEVTSWGGRAAMRHPATVRQIRQELDASAPFRPLVSRSAESATPPGSSGLRQSLLASMVVKLHTARTKLSELNRRPRNPLGWGFPVGLVAGWVAGEIYYAKEYPYYDSFPNAFGRVPFDWPSVLVGILVGLLVWAVWLVVSFAVTSTRKESSRVQLVSLTEELTREFPAEVAAWGGPAVLRDAGIVRRLRDQLNPPATAPVSPTATLTSDDITADQTRRAVLVARMRDHAKLLKDTKDRSDMTWGWLVFLWMFGAPVIGGLFSSIPYLWGSGDTTRVVFGVIGGVLAAWLFWWAMGAVRRHQVQKREAGIERFAADYPRLVEGWGGRIVLESPESVTALLKTIDPVAMASPPGFFRRLFGG